MLSFTFHFRGALKWLLFFCILNFSPACYGQGENAVKADNSPYVTFSDDNTALLNYYVQKVDSISHTTGIARHFAGIYTKSMSNIAMKMQSMEGGVQAFVKKFEIGFINYFLEACAESENGQLPSGSVWSCYFSNPGVQPWQHVLIGVNAHVNGDIWKGLVKNFSENEIRRYKKNLLAFQSSIAKAFNPLFEEIMEQSAYLRFINSFTKGMAKRFGEWLIFNWRRRQIDLAILYFQDQKKFEKKFAVINRKKQRIDRVILRQTKQPKQAITVASANDNDGRK